MSWRDVNAAAAEFVVEKPGAWNSASVLLRRIELPIARRVESDSRKVRAGTVRGVFGVGYCARCIHIDAYCNADCAVNGVAGALRNVRNIAADDITVG